jgi:hypothetical protein
MVFLGIKCYIAIPMRFLNIIFSFYIIALSIMPCTDIAACDHEEYENMGIAHPEEDHENCEDTCSPFCACNCCGITIAFSVIEPFNIEPLVISEKTNTLFKLSEFSIFHHSVWQPPKI